MRQEINLADKENRRVGLDLRPLLTLSLFSTFTKAQSLISQYEKRGMGRVLCPDYIPLTSLPLVKGKGEQNDKTKIIAHPLICG